MRSYPNTLSAWIAGSEHFELLDDNTIAEECTKLLRKFLNDSNVPEPEKITRSFILYKIYLLISFNLYYKICLHRTKWNQNRWIKGSYSHLPLGAKLSDIEILSKPIPNEKVKFIHSILLNYLLMYFLAKKSVFNALLNA